MDYFLSVQNIEKSFGGNHVLRGTSLDVKRGEFVTLLGASGCGKTTLLRIIAGLEYPDSGSVVLDGTEITALPPEKRQLGMVFQNYALFEHLTVEENVGYALKLRRVPKDERRERVNAMLAKIGLSGTNRKMPDQLSGGQRQRVALARSLISTPKLLLLDEPLGALDAALRRRMQVELKNLQNELGITFLYITHDEEEAVNMSDRIALMSEGVFQKIGAPDEIREDIRL